MLIDSISTAILLTAVSVAMAVALLATSVRQPSPVGAAQRIWALALVCAPTGWSLLEIANTDVSLALLAIAGKALLFAAFVGYLHALMVLRGSFPSATWQWLPVLAVVLATTGLYLVWPERSISSGVLSWLCALTVLASAFTAGRDARSGGNRQGRLISIAFLVSAAALMIHGLMAILPNDPAGIWTSQPLAQTFLFGTAIVAPLVASLGFVLMCSDRLFGRLETFAHVDEVTGLANRQTLMQRARGIVADARQRGIPCALLTIQVDPLRAITDRHGREAGDQALASIARTLRSHLRADDCIGRGNDDGFAVLLPGHNLEAGHGIGQRLCRGVAATCIDTGGERQGLSISIGVAALLGVEDTLDAMYQRASLALDQARNDGGNRAIIYCIEPSASAIQISAA